MDDFAREYDTPGHGTSVDRVRMLPLVVVQFRWPAVADGEPEETVCCQMHLAVLGAAEAHCRFDQRVEHRVRTLPACDRPHHVDERVLLLVQPCELPREFGRVHAEGSNGAIVRPKPRKFSQYSSAGSF